VLRVLWLQYGGWSRSSNRDDESRVPELGQNLAGVAEILIIHLHVLLSLYLTSFGQASGCILLSSFCTATLTLTRSTMSSRYVAQYDKVRVG